MGSVMAETEEVATCVLPPLPRTLDRLWETIIDIGQALSTDSWMLVGGQMVMLHGLIAGRVMTRATNDIDVLAAVLVPPARPKLSDCVRAVKKLGFKPLEANEPDLLHRFVHPDDGAVIDILAPDHQSWLPIIKPPRATVRIDGGTQALQRAATVRVSKGSRAVEIAIPSLLGALVLKAAAFKTEKLRPERHAADAAFLASLINDPISVKNQFKGSDYSRILFLDRELADPEHPAWMALGEYAEDALTVWRILRQSPRNPQSATV
jgi:predicted nucleotidyltransferase